MLKKSLTLKNLRTRFKESAVGWILGLSDELALERAYDQHIKPHIEALFTQIALRRGTSKNVLVLNSNAQVFAVFENKFPEIFGGVYGNAPKAPDHEHIKSKIIINPGSELSANLEALEFALRRIDRTDDPREGLLMYWNNEKTFGAARRALVAAKGLRDEHATVPMPETPTRTRGIIGLQRWR